MSFLVVLSTLLGLIYGATQVPTQTPSQDPTMEPTIMTLMPSLAPTINLVPLKFLIYNATINGTCLVTVNSTSSKILTVNGTIYKNYNDILSSDVVNITMNNTIMNNGTRRRLLKVLKPIDYSLTLNVSISKKNDISNLTIVENNGKMYLENDQGLRNEMESDIIKQVFNTYKINITNVTIDNINTTSFNVQTITIKPLRKPVPLIYIIVILLVLMGIVIGYFMWKERRAGNNNNNDKKNVELAEQEPKKNEPEPEELR